MTVSVALPVPPDGDAEEDEESEATAPAPGPGEVIFTEIMRNPQGGPDRLREWVEVKNVSDAPRDLLGCQYRDGAGPWIIIEESLPLEPGGRALFAASGDPAGRWRCGTGPAKRIDLELGISVTRLGLQHSLPLAFIHPGCPVRNERHYGTA
jgi:hypothetical protein